MTLNITQEYHPGYALVLERMDHFQKYYNYTKVHSESLSKIANIQRVASGSLHIDNQEINKYNGKIRKVQKMLLTILHTKVDFYKIINSLTAKGNSYNLTANEMLNQIKKLEEYEAYASDKLGQMRNHIKFLTSSNEEIKEKPLPLPPVPPKSRVRFPLEPPVSRIRFLNEKPLVPPKSRVRFLLAPPKSRVRFFKEVDQLVPPKCQNKFFRNAEPLPSPLPQKTAPFPL